MLLHALRRLSNSHLAVRVKAGRVSSVCGWLGLNLIGNILKLFISNSLYNTDVLASFAETCVACAGVCILEEQAV